ncbi:MAG TPA: anti-sigma factor [Pyrinomonadaceae bacterium]
MSDEMKEIMLDLLCKKAVYGLDANEENRLADLQRRAGAQDESLSFELTAAAIMMASVDKGEEMPVALRDRIAADAEKHFEPRRSTSPAAPAVADEPVGGSLFGWLGWAFAAAACLALAFNLYYTTRTTDVAQVRPTPSPEAQLTPEQMRQRLIETSPDIARGAWAAGNVKDVTPEGDIVWSDTKQAGYMRLKGLPVNDPTKETYQLWIFDETQSDKTPIDGGTFNVNSEGEIIVPIDAKLQPRNTKMYAITIEKPGGVVVSDRKRLVALAKRET